MELGKNLYCEGSAVFPLQVCDLKENKKYQFQVRAANMAGVGIPSLPSNTFLCEEWTIAVPGEEFYATQTFSHLSVDEEWFSSRKKQLAIFSSNSV